ncbi:MAG TPA: tRNA (uridine(34)/cytosine(34)/5-carboxymethylaminomethyluridine(34)-2'-O)-methyltransferase TrmL [Firmicutes bacterium]|jgi:tRNA (cytidine/uridine-2'-O-)-methyltransferase|nr:tRNA (uridine(34)/cytosine(34)/5-carboxymethylaminomethyluridine(34)-2'-O)-methyltransferase TrmL [Bacillota bacterium]
MILINIVLYEPEIPQNTGNIARLCAATLCNLHLIEPLGFHLDDRHLRRAGLDYWPLVKVYRYLDFDEFLQARQTEQARFFFLTTKAKKSYTDVAYQKDDYLVFGPETRGLPPEVLARQPEHNLRIPMRDEARSLNLSNSVAIVLYEALRQTGFSDLR